MSIRTAGSSVSAEATARPTTIAPAMPTERRIMNSKRISPSRPRRTVRPLKNTARPAVATVTRTASATRVGPGGPQRQLLAEAARQQERVVDAQAETEQRREVEHEDAHRHDRGDQEDRRERHQDRGPADDERDAGRDGRAEDHEQRQRGERERDDLAPLEVGLGHGLHVAVEGGSAGQLDRQARRLVQALAQDRQRLRRVVGRQVEEDDVVGGVAVGRDLPRRDEVRDHPRDVRRPGDVRDGRRRRAFEGGCAGLDRRAVEDDDERRRRGAELAAEEGLRARGLQVVEDEPAGTQASRDLRREREGGQHQQGPRRDHPPRASRDEPAEAVEGGHLVIVVRVAR